MTAVADLGGADLALWVARAEGICLHTAGERKESGNWGTDYYCLACGNDTSEGPSVHSWSPHEKWAQGGPLIESVKINIECANIIKHLEAKGRNFSGPNTNHDTWRAEINGEHVQFGTLPLEAAMRALVASVYGDNVPDEVSS